MPARHSANFTGKRLIQIFHNLPCLSHFHIKRELNKRIIRKYIERIQLLQLKIILFRKCFKIGIGGF
ncbi:conserved hypothetical protein [Listeria monocytogenes str. 4b H7858]|nr:conserved hypothetical protein [Listeria monocytogenes str. 4b H7858] [Listeria monocytogenes serotype 4b str. H7858]